MKRIATLYLLLLLVLTVAAHAQPQVSYMIPDVGAAGMNTYVEIIGPTGATGNFGSSDDIFLNVPGDAVRVVPVTATDTSKILIGPVVVSWGGRMISTQIFVRPGAPNGTIFLQVVVNNGTPSAPIPFDVVTPQTLGTAGTLTGGGVIGSGGNLGTRSKRGAMIVSSLTLQSGTFTVNTTDPDNLTAGNQGYLPFILLSKGPIRVQSGVTLNVNGTSGTSGNGGNGGPGGGGGGGGDNDVITGGSGPSGGDGFTGGGPGSVNRSIGGSGWGFSGTSSGSNPTTTNVTANALNGARGGMSSWSCAEDAGGGTGHPFGTGGNGSCPGTTNASGGYGGGGGGDQRAVGGGGGYGGVGGNAGSISGSGATSAGKVHGNDMAVPVAGGSGGASGNPQGINASSGGGGGGGGALVLYSMADMVNAGTLEARGAAGGNGTPNGGSGSGGLVEIGTKVRTTNGGTANVAGGAASGGLGAGGFGRFRADGFGNANAPGTGTRYAGPSIDSLTYVQARTFTLQGTYNGASGVTLRVYMKNDNSPGWSLLGAPTTSGTTWSLSFTATAGAGNYYFVVAQSVPLPGTGQYDAQPKWVLSQAAANIIKVELTAKINTDKTVDNFADLVCETERVDSVKVWNSGDDILRVTPSLALNNQGFTLVSPTGPFTLAPDSSLYVKIRFVPTAPGTKADTLVLANNDLRPGMNPKKVTLIAKKLNVNPYFDKTDFDFGEVCKDSTISRTIWFHYVGDVQGEFIQVTRIATGQSSFTLVPPTRRTVNSGDSVGIVISFHPTTSGLFSDQFEVLVGPCNQKVTFSVRATGTYTQALVNPDTIKFSDVRINVPSTKTFSVINTGTVSGKITKVYIVPADPAFQITTDPTGTTLFPTQQAAGAIKFLPTEAKDYQVKVFAIIDGNCPDTASAVVTGRGVTSLLFLSRKEIEISADKCSDPAPTVTDTFKLFNLGTAGAQIDAISSLHGLVSATTSPALSRTLDPHDSMAFTITWTPGVVGTQYDTLRISTQSEDPKQREILLPLTLVRDKWDVTIVKGDGSTLPAEVDLGSLFKCSVPAQYNLLLKNLGTVNDTAVGGLAKGTDFTLTPAVLPYTVDAGASKPLTITFGFNAPTQFPVQGTYRDTLTIRSTVCSKEIRVPIVASFFDITFDAPEVDYGKKNIGFPSVKPVSVTNTSVMPNNIHYHIVGAEIHPPTAPFTVSAPISYPQEIAPGESFSQNVAFTPPAVGDYTAELWYILDGPCPDTIKVPLKGTGIESNVLVQPSALNFGTKYLCQDDSVLTVTVKNTGKAAFDLLGLNIDGANPESYEVTKSPKPLPSSLAPGQVDTLEIHFMPSRAGADGLLRAVLHILTNDPTNPEVTVDLIGERRRQVLTTPSLLDFGSVEVGESDTLEVTFQNRTTDTLTIDNLAIDPPFEVLDQPLPIKLGPSGSPTDSIRLKVRFTPADSVESDLPLIIAESSPCTDTARMTVHGKGKITPVGTADIVIPLTVTGKPGTRVAIPIIMEKTLALDLTGATTFIAKIRFNKTLLKPLGARSKGESIKKGVAGAVIEGGSMTNTEVIGHDMVVTVQITNSPMLLQPDTLGFLDAFVMLGDAATTPLTIDTLYWTDGLVRGTKRDGLFSLSDYCTDGGDRLVVASGQFGIKAAVPNPFNPSTEITFRTVEAGETTLAIYDSYGRLVDVLVDRESLPIADHKVTWYATGAASGLYYAVLTAPTERSIYPLMLVK